MLHTMMTNSLDDDNDKFYHLLTRHYICKLKYCKFTATVMNTQ